MTRRRYRGGVLDSSRSAWAVHRRPQGAEATLLRAQCSGVRAGTGGNAQPASRGGDALRADPAAARVRGSGGPKLHDPARPVSSCGCGKMSCGCGVGFEETTGRVLALMRRKHVDSE